MSGLLALLDDVAAIAKVAAASIDDIAGAAAKAGASIRMGVDHPHYQAELTLAPQVRDALAADLA